LREVVRAEAEELGGLRDYIGHDLFVSVAEVRLAVDVINGGGDINRLLIGAQCDGRARDWQLCGARCLDSMRMSGF
jgi:hypothetical protein